MKKNEDENRLVEIASFCSTIDAELFKAKLKSYGVNSVLLGDNIARMNIFYSKMDGGIKLMVRAKDALKASGLLRVTGDKYSEEG